MSEDPGREVPAEGLRVPLPEGDWRSAEMYGGTVARWADITAAAEELTGYVTVPNDQLEEVIPALDEVLHAPGEGFLIPERLASAVLEGRTLREFLDEFRDSPKQQITMDSLRRPLEERPVSPPPDDSAPE